VIDALIPLRRFTLVLQPAMVSYTLSAEKTTIPVTQPLEATEICPLMAGAQCRPRSRVKAGAAR